MPAVLSLLIDFLGGGLDSAVALSGSPGGVTMLALIAAAALFLALAVVDRSDLANSAALSPVVVRRRADRTAFLPLCDPAAAGRPQPRAPSAHHRVT